MQKFSFKDLFAIISLVVGAATVIANIDLLFSNLVELKDSYVCNIPTKPLGLWANIILLAIFFTCCKAFMHFQELRFRKNLSRADILGPLILISIIIIMGLIQVDECYSKDQRMSISALFSRSILDPEDTDLKAPFAIVLCFGLLVDYVIRRRIIRSKINPDLKKLNDQLTTTPKIN